MADLLDSVLVVQHGKLIEELRTFQDVQAYLATPPGEYAIGIGRTLRNARSTQQKAIALAEFVEWARKTGILVEMKPAETELHGDLLVPQFKGPPPALLGARLRQ